jgi:hypothetical protein
MVLNGVRKVDTETLEAVSEEVMDVLVKKEDTVTDDKYNAFDGTRSPVLEVVNTQLLDTGCSNICRR